MTISMETIEIRQNKKTLIPMLVIPTLALFGTTYYIYFSGRYENNNTIKLLYAFSTALLVYAIYFPMKKLINNEPVLKFNKSGLEINDKGKPVSFPWLQITNWKIESDEDGTYYLEVETADSKKKINISWLEKRPAEIEELFLTFKTNKSVTKGDEL